MMEKWQFKYFVTEMGGGGRERGGGGRGMRGKHGIADTQIIFLHNNNLKITQ